MNESDFDKCITCGKKFIGRGFHCFTHKPRKVYRCIECGDSFPYTRGRRTCTKCKPMRVKKKVEERSGI